MRLTLRYFTVPAIALAWAADSSYGVAGTVPDGTSSIPQQSSGYTVSYTEYDSRSVCDMRSAERFGLRGLHSKYVLRDLPNSSRFDAEHATFDVGVRRSSAAVVLDGGTNLCWIGGRILSRQILHGPNVRGRANAIAMQIRNLQTLANVILRNLHIIGGFNGVSISGDLDSLVWERGELRELDGSCLIIDTFMLAAFRDSLLDGCFRLIEVRDNSQYKKIILDRNVIRIKIDHDGPVNSDHISLYGDSVNGSVVLRDNIILFDGPIEDPVDYVHNSVTTNITECENNVFIFPAMDHSRELEVDCGYLTHDRGIWEEAKTAWLEFYSDEDLSSDAGTAAEDGTWDMGVADGAGTGSSSYGSGAIESRDPVTGLQTQVAEPRDVASESRELVRDAIAAADRAARAADLFLGRWSDDTFWLDGTGWLE